MIEFLTKISEIPQTTIFALTIICCIIIDKTYKSISYFIANKDNGIEQIHGQYRVVYKDGKISQRMHLKTAKDYAGIFGGVVIKDSKP